MLGVEIVQIVFLPTKMLNSIENGYMTGAKSEKFSARVLVLSQ